MAEPTPTALNIQALPKISLHDHLDGGLRPSTILEIAEAEGVALPIEDATGSPIADAGRLGEWFAEKSDSGSLVEYLKTFDVTTAVMQSEAGLHRIKHTALLNSKLAECLQQAAITITETIAKTCNCYYCCCFKRP